MKKKLICMSLITLTLLTVSVPCSAATLNFHKTYYPKKIYLSIPRIPRLPRFTTTINKNKDSYDNSQNVQTVYENTVADNDFILEHIDKDFERCVSLGDKSGCLKCEMRYATAANTIIEYAERYYDKDLLNKINNDVIEMEKKLEKLYGGLNTPFQPNDTTIDVMNQRGLLYKELCHKLDKIKVEQEGKLDESEITVGHKEAYNEETQTGFKSIENNEYRYYENGRMLNNEWKEFDDGYRFFNSNGTMAHNTTECGLEINDNGIVTFIDGSQKDKYYPIIDQSTSTDLKFISHTFRVFDVPMNIKYIETSDKENDGYVYSCNVDFQYTGFGNNDTVNATAEIEVYKYADRLNLNN